jgi:hypothetical protein
MLFFLLRLLVIYVSAKLLILTMACNFEHVTDNKKNNQHATMVDMILKLTEREKMVGWFV